MIECGEKKKEVVREVFICLTRFERGCVFFFIYRIVLRRFVGWYSMYST